MSSVKVEGPSNSTPMVPENLLSDQYECLVRGLKKKKRIFKKWRNQKDDHTQHSCVFEKG